jgi:hypothetical protein
MRAPDTKSSVNSGIGRIERLCRAVGGHPKSGKHGTPHREFFDRQIWKLLHREVEQHGDVSDAEWHALAQYLKGEFNRKPEEGRPLTDGYKEAVARALVVLGIDDPDGREAKALLKRVTR